MCGREKSAAGWNRREREEKSGQQHEKQPVNPNGKNVDEEKEVVFLQISAGSGLKIFFKFRLYNISSGDIITAQFYMVCLQAVVLIRILQGVESALLKALSKQRLFVVLLIEP